MGASSQLPLSSSGPGPPASASFDSLLCRNLWPRPDLQTQTLHLNKACRTVCTSQSPRPPSHEGHS